MTIFNFLPSTLFHSAPTRCFDGYPIAKIYASSGLGSTAHSPFDDYSDSLIDGLLSDPFDLSISPSFVFVNNSFCMVSASPLFGVGQNYLDNDLASYGDRSTTRRPRARNAYFRKRDNVSEANWNKQFLCDRVHARTYVMSEINRYGDFPCLFWVPLKNVDELHSLGLCGQRLNSEQNNIRELQRFQAKGQTTCHVGTQCTWTQYPIPSPVQ